MIREQRTRMCATSVSVARVFSFGLLLEEPISRISPRCRALWPVETLAIPQSDSSGISLGAALPEMVEKPDRTFALERSAIPSVRACPPPANRLNGCERGIQIRPRRTTPDSRANCRSNSFDDEALQQLALDIEASGRDVHGAGSSFCTGRLISSVRAVLRDQI